MDTKNHGLNKDISFMAHYSPLTVHPTDLSPCTGVKSQFLSPLHRNSLQLTLIHTKTPFSQVVKSINIIKLH